MLAVPTEANESSTTRILECIMPAVYSNTRTPAGSRSPKKERAAAGAVRVSLRRGDEDPHVHAAEGGRGDEGDQHRLVGDEK